jgi:hypothetical protein
MEPINTPTFYISGLPESFEEDDLLAMLEKRIKETNEESYVQNAMSDSTTPKIEIVNSEIIHFQIGQIE